MNFLLCLCNSLYATLNCFFKFLLGMFVVTTCYAVNCDSSLKLQGEIFIEPCDDKTMDCVSSSEAVYNYMKNVDDSPEIITVALHASPWRFYDAQMRIIKPKELAKKIEPLIKKGVEKVDLISSWTSISPDKALKPLAQRLSSALNGFPVTGKDGFLWVNKKGKLRTTQQAFTIWKSPYNIKRDSEVMISLAASWMVGSEDVFIKEKNVEGIIRAAFAWDILMLCPDQALRAFELAAKLDHPIAAYNAALIRFERNNKGDSEIAFKLLSKAAELGDKKAKAELKYLVN